MSEQKEYLKQLAKELHKPAKKKFPRRSVIVAGKDDVWSCDLVEMQEWKDENDGFRYMLNAVDVFTKKAWSVPLKDKTGGAVTKAFEKIFEESKRMPKKLWVDQGGEFYNKELDKLRKKHSIIMYSTFGDHKSMIVERFNRTLKSRMWKRFTQDNTRRWVDMLPELMAEYNKSNHSSIDMSPNAASKLTAANEQKLWKEVYGETATETKAVKKGKAKFKLGDFVRVSRIKGIFEKGYLPRWSQEMFKVVSITYSDPIVYAVEDWDGERVKGSFYENELQKTKLNETALVEKVVAERKVRGKKQYLVKWLGWNSKFNRWVNEADLGEIPE